MEPQEEPDIPALQEPVTIQSCLVALDGGTLCVALRDAAEQTFNLCFDNSMGSSTRGRLYVGAFHPTDAGARMAPLNGEAERAVIRLFQEFFDLRPSIKSRYVTETEGHIQKLTSAITRLTALSESSKPAA